MSERLLNTSCKDRLPTVGDVVDQIIAHEQMQYDDPSRAHRYWDFVERGYKERQVPPSAFEALLDAAEQIVTDVKNVIRNNEESINAR